MPGARLELARYRVSGDFESGRAPKHRNNLARCASGSGGVRSRRLPAVPAHSVTASVTAQLFGRLVLALCGVRAATAEWGS